jgi:cell division protease FtsH
MARQMVTKYGMSEKLGPLQYGKTDELIFLGRQIQEERNYSEDVAKLIDSEVKEIIDAARQKAYEVLTAHKDKLDAVVRRLITDETISSEEFDRIFEDEEVIPAAAATGASTPPAGTTGGEDRRTGKGPAPAPSPA